MNVIIFQRSTILELYSNVIMEHIFLKFVSNIPDITKVVLYLRPQIVTDNTSKEVFTSFRTHNRHVGGTTCQVQISST